MSGRTIERPPGRRFAGALVASLVAVTACAHGGDGNAEAGAPAIPALDRALERLVPFGFSGAVLVVEGDRTRHARGYGLADREAGRPVTPETVFDIGSLSKQFTAAAVILLAERGRLAVEDSIGRYVPAVPEDKRGITIHHLLTHTSGLPPFHSFSEGGVHGDFKVLTREEAERSIMERPLDFPPGDGWTYSNSGYTLLAAIVERVAGRPFEAVLREDLLGPAGLEHTGLYFQPLWGGVPVAHGYTGEGDEGSPLAWTDTDELWGLIGNGGVLSTIEDLRRWDRALRGGSVLPERAVERLFTPHAEVRSGLHSGYGWYIEDEDPGGRVVRHGGANDFGFGARWRRLLEADRLVVVLINRQPPAMDVSLAADAVEALVSAAMSGEDFDLPPEVAPGPGAVDLERYAGRYRFADGGEIAIRPSAGALVVDPQGPVPVRALAFPSASASEIERVRRLDLHADEILDGIVRGDYEPLTRLMADTSALGFYRDYIADWWAGFTEAGAGREDLEVVGTVPIWWSPGDDRLATVIRAGAGDRSDHYRLHWRDGRIVGLGGGAVQRPATTLFAPTGPGEFVGYHLGIRRPVRLVFETDSAGEVTAVRLEPATGPVTARRLPD